MSIHLVRYRAYLGAVLYNSKFDAAITAATYTCAASMD